MSSAKSILKAAKIALDSHNYDEAVTQAKKALTVDPQSYHANVFLGLALDKQGKDEEAFKAYESATSTKDKDTLAWQGMISLYEKQGGRKLGDYKVAAVRLAEIYMEADDKHRCQVVIDKYMGYAKQHGSRTQYKHALEVLLPSSTVYDFLEGRIQQPSYTYLRLAEIVEAEEKEEINKQIGERRTRLGAKIGQVTADVKREVLVRSSLEQIYQNIIDWSSEDGVRRQYEEKLLQRAYDTLVVLPEDQKVDKRKQVESLSRGIVILKHPFELAWEINIEWKDGESLADWDAGVLRDFIDFFPNNGLSKVLKGYMKSEISPFPTNGAQVDADGAAHPEEDVADLMGDEDVLLLMTEGVDESTDSVLGHRLMSEFLLFLEEYETTVSVSRNARRLLTVETQKSGLKFESNLDAINITLASSLIQYQSPKNHPEARLLFDGILERKPTSTAALIGVGLILEEQDEFPAAIDFLSRALTPDANNPKVKAEAAWCKALNGEYSESLAELEPCLLMIEGTDPRSRDLKAQTLYRIGICLWNIDSSKTSRKNRKGAYARFLSALRVNLNFAPAYTSLGLYYADYVNDKKRARKCFQKAFELSPSEVEAAKRLALAFADKAEWDLVEVVARRVVDSGKLRPAPGSRKKGVSWPFAALGVAELNKQDYSRSIVSFQSALRISPEDYHSWVGLGESYHNSGRYIAATKAFQQAEKFQAQVVEREGGEVWFAKYMLANVKRELGDYEDAVTGYEEVLHSKPQEFGVSIALLQTLVEQAWRHVELGFFGRAAGSSRRALEVARDVVVYRADAFNLWKAVGDACSIFSWVTSRGNKFPVAEIKSILETKIDMQEYDLFADIDGIGQNNVFSLVAEKGLASNQIDQCLHAAILAHKRAIYASALDLHAQAVAWYNLGWTEHRAHVCQAQKSQTKRRKATKFQRAAMRCFKRAIELEAGNSEFWNALGVVTSQLNPKVSQHSFVRSLYLNDKSAKVWTNLGTLYLMEGDHQLANDTFTRAQSTDPEYAHAWLGQGILAMLFRDPKEAQYLFTHAFEIANSSSLLTKRQYTLSTFDYLLSISAASNNITNIIQPLFALQQLHTQAPHDLPYYHLFSLFQERIGNYSAAVDSLTFICANVEADYEVSESASSLAHFAQAKADLARAQLAEHDYLCAAENAQTALDFMSGDSASFIDASARRKCRLSAQLTAGLAYYYTNSMDSAIDMFRASLEESDGAPDIVCLLAQVLWAKGGEDEKGVARDQLFDCVEKHPDHVGAVVLLGVIAVLDGDRDTLEAVTADVQALRTSEAVNSGQRRDVGTLLAVIAALGSDNDQEAEEMAEATTSVMLSPMQSQGWSQLAALSSDIYPAEMALKTALRAAPPVGTLEAKDLAEVFAVTGRLGDAQRAIMVAPRCTDGWEELVDVVA
ncbi:MAG: Superkiller protein 3 [Pycnora praestabilis]|nr:MAG: Superkiller protein 3 [Pycnora praestabilis]